LVESGEERIGIRFQDWEDDNGFSGKGISILGEKLHWIEEGDMRVSLVEDF